MPSLDQVREFRHAAAPATDEARRRAHERLTRAIDAEARLEAGLDSGRIERTKVGRWLVKRRTPVLALGVLLAAGAAALFLSTPWQHSPGFLERAAFALPTANGRILHMKSEFTTTSTNPACTVTFGPNETWIDQTPPYRFRNIYVNPDVPESTTDARVLVCAKAGTPTEVGGPVNARVARFTSPNTLLNVGTVQTSTRPPDPVRDLRAGISAGRAHDEGKTTLDGRNVELIRVDPPHPPNCPVPCPREPSYVYVDPDTFYPVAEQTIQDITLDAVNVVRVKFITRYLAYEYLPRTPEDLALTNIRAQHPTACLKDFWGPGITNPCR